MKIIKCLFLDKACVPQGALSDCQAMAAASGLHITCVAARDR